MISLHERFTCGDCHLLANAINELTGWSVCTFLSSDEPETHAFVKMPDGRYLDIEGASSGWELLDRWRETEIREWGSFQDLCEASPEWSLIEWPNSPKIAMKTAKQLLWHGKTRIAS